MLEGGVAAGGPGGKKAPEWTIPILYTLLPGLRLVDKEMLAVALDIHRRPCIVFPSP